MTDRPILFSAEMVRAILDGRKTQTRRIMKPVPTFNAGGAILDADGGQEDYVVPHWVLPSACSCPYGQPGDTLWVREAWRVHKSYDILNAARVYGAMGGDVAYCVDYLATPRQENFWGRGRPSIHMPRWASRITLRITDIRVERVQDISEDDAIQEGMELERYVPVSDSAGLHACGEAEETNPLEEFRNLWTSINGPGAWEANTWVWAISFERVKP
jgi:hypothetical protein